GAILVFYLIIAVGPLVFGDKYGLSLFILAMTVLTLGSFMSIHSFSPLHYDPETGMIRSETASDLPASLVGWMGAVLLVLSGATSAWIYLHDSWLAFIPFLIPLAYNLWAMTWMYRRY
ncbi:MAG: hypothetical protein KC964_23270, partial [Candidatus Omnitrophica bacterium]|nr:hypothetical protein [Candidatus Omnitrophota bacterium]